MSEKSANSPKQPGNTATTDDKGRQRPRLPHEHDESADSQHSQPRTVIRQAHEDIESGQEDTDLRGSQGRREPSVPASTDAPHSKP